MLAEINLLPRKDPKNLAKRFVLLTCLVLSVLVLTSLSFHVRSLQIEKSEAESERIFLQEQLEKALQDHNQSKGYGSAAKELQSAVKFAQASTSDSVPVIEELTKLLPERGYLLSYQQADPESINLVVQFDMSRDAAFYLTRLKDSPMFESARLNKITAKKVSRTSQNSEADTSDAEGIPRVEATYQLKVKTNDKGNGGGSNEDTAA